MTRGADRLGLFDAAPEGGRRQDTQRGQRAAASRRRRRRLRTAVVLLVLLAGLAGGAWYGLRQVRGIGQVADYTGPGERDLVVEVADGATTAQIGAELARSDVVASGAAFVRAAAGNAKIRAVQPGFYVMRSKTSAAAAVARIVDPDIK